MALRLGPRALQEMAYRAVDGSYPSRLKQLQLRLESPYAEREVEMGLESGRECSRFECFFSSRLKEFKVV